MTELHIDKVKPEESEIWKNSAKNLCKEYPALRENAALCAKNSLYWRFENRISCFFSKMRIQTNTYWF